jgi:MinD superfamily P-loop ATPase
VGCPVIASIQGSDFVVAVTEPTPSALHDLRRVLYIADHFGIPKGLVLNKSDLDRGFAMKMESFARKAGIPVLGRIPYRQDFVESTVKMKPVVACNKDYESVFQGIAEKITASLGKGP